MSRRGNIKRKPVPPDPIYNSCLLNMTIRRVMKSGKKSLAAGIVYDAMTMIKERTGEEPLDVI